MRHYAAESDHGSESSHGFSNDWTVYVFESKGARDEFVQTRKNLTTVAIKRHSVTKIATNWNLTQNRSIKPRPFSNDFWGIVDYFSEDLDGCIGTIAVCDDWNYGERFYK